MPIATPTDWTTEASKVDKHQNPWSVVNDFSKTIVTLAASILAVSAAFASNILGGTPSRWLVFLVLGSWFFLILTIAFSVYATGALTSYLRGTEPKSWPVSLFSNLSFIALVVALILFATAGGLKLWTATRTSDISGALRTVIAFDAYPNTGKESLTHPAILSISRSDASHQWIAMVAVRYGQDATEQTKNFRLTVDDTGQTIVSLEALP